MENGRRGMDNTLREYLKSLIWSYRSFVAMVQASNVEGRRLGRGVGVVRGRGGNFLKGVPFALRVRIVAPQERIARVSSREDIDEDWPPTH